MTKTKRYRTKEAAIYLDMKQNTLEYWRIRGFGPEYLKIGRSVFYTQQALDAYLEQCRRRSTSEEKAG